MKNQILKALKKTTQLALVLLLAVSITNCSKDDAPAAQSNPPAVAAEQNPLAGFLSASGFDQMTTSQSVIGSGERGISFTPLVDGKMTALVLKMPAARNGIRVSIWNKADGIKLRTETLNIATANQETTKTIEAINLVKDKEYIICFDTGDFYTRERTNGSNASYPYTIGDIKINGYCQIQTFGAMPSIYPVRFYNGDCSFKFQK